MHKHSDFPHLSLANVPTPASSFGENTSNGAWPSLQILAYNQSNCSSHNQGSETGESRKSRTPKCTRVKDQSWKNRKVNFRGRIQAGPINPDHQRLGGYADNVLIPHYRRRPSCGQMGGGQSMPIASELELLQSDWGGMGVWS